MGVWLPAAWTLAGMIPLENLPAAWREFQAGGDPRLREALIDHYAALVPYIARRVAANAPAHVDREEFISYGYFGLIDAVDRFEPGRGIKFETYATKRIRGAILDGLRSEDNLTRLARKRIKDARLVMAEYEARFNREPTIEEIAAQLGVTTAELSSALQLENTGSMPEQVVDLGGDDPEVELEVADARSRLAERVARLPERDRAFVLLYYCQAMTLIDVGAELGVSDSRAGQIRLEVLRALRG